MPPRWPIPPTFSSRKCQMLSITEWVALIGGLSAAVVALVKVASDAAKTRAEIALIRADLTRAGSGTIDERLAVADASIAEFFATRGIDPVWLLDTEDGGTFAAQIHYGETG